jgi:Flp pilus assembly protein TadG
MFRWDIGRRGVAAVEFAIICPVLLSFAGGLVDFGLAMAGRSQLANGLAQGVQYALDIGPSVTAASIQSMVQAGAARAGLSPTVTVQVTGPACYCTSGSPVALVTPSTPLSGTYTCTGTCASGATPGAYAIISATFTYTPLLPFYSRLSSTTVKEAVTVRLL